MGDFDQDGCDDFVVAGAADPRGAAVVLSGRTGRLLQVGYGPQPGDNIGWAVDGCGDLDGDGVPDFVASNNAVFQRAVVVAFSGATGAVLYEWNSNQLGVGFEGYDVRGGGIDVDRDGVPDIVVGAKQQKAGKLYVFSGRDGSVILRDNPPDPGALGTSLAVVGKGPGSPLPVFVASAPDHGSRPFTLLAALGGLRVYRGSPPGAQVYGLPCQGTLAKAPKIGMRALETTGTRITVHDGPEGSTAILLLGISRSAFGGLVLPAPLAPAGFPGCFLQTSIEVPLMRRTGVEGIAAGYTFVDLPAAPAAGGALVHAQWLCVGEHGRAPGGLSDALEFRVQ
jgi:hypothetical protein